MTSLKAFTKFPELPPEIQLQIWESTVATQPAMHLFDVCVPPCVLAAAATTTASQTSGSDDDDEGAEDTDPAPTKTESIYLDEAADTLYLSPLVTTATEDPAALEDSTPTQGARFSSDPSMYKFRAGLAATCIDSAATVRRALPATPAPGAGAGDTNTDTDTNTIYLGAPSTERGCASVTYDNTQDVLHLRFSPPAFRFPDGGRLKGPLSAVFESLWSQELAGALHRARRVAIDVSQLWPCLRPHGVADGEEQQGDDGGEGEAEVAGQEVDGGEQQVDGDEEEADADEEMDGDEEVDGDEEAGDIDDHMLIIQDMAFLACMMEHDLEVLYLVDYCAGRCDSHPSSSLRAQDLMDRRDDGLYRTLGNGETWQKEKMRKPDVFQGVGKVWREVFDLEKLGWDEGHPGVVFADIFGEVIKMQQRDAMGDDSQDAEAAKERVKFQGVRVLVAEDEEVNGEASPMLLRCDGHGHGTEKEGHSP